MSSILFYNVFKTVHGNAMLLTINHETALKHWIIIIVIIIQLLSSNNILCSVLVYCKQKLFPKHESNVRWFLLVVHTGSLSCSHPDSFLKIRLAINDLQAHSWNYIKVVSCCFCGSYFHVNTFYDSLQMTCASGQPQEQWMNALFTFINQRHFLWFLPCPVTRLL